MIYYSWLINVQSNPIGDKKVKSQQIEEDDSSSDLETYLRKLESPIAKLK